jgi:hypothetical protein
MRLPLTERTFGNGFNPSGLLTRTITSACCTTRQSQGRMDLMSLAAVRLIQWS